MDVAADGDRCLDGLHVAFLDEDLLHFLAKDAQLPLWQNGALFDCLQPVVDVTLTHFCSISCKIINF